MKICLVRSMLISIALYGVETWTLINGERDMPSKCGVGSGCCASHGCKTLEHLHPQRHVKILSYFCHVKNVEFGKTGSHRNIRRM